jgi:tetratricopeptide (TPR) repeat protein
LPRQDSSATKTSPYARARSSNELALQAFKKLGALPPSAELHTLKAEILSNHDNKLEAVAEWKAAQELAPDDPRIARQIAVALYEARDYTRAVPLLEQMLRANPDAADLHFFVGDSWLQQSQPEKALQPLETAVRLEPNLLPARAALGLTLIRLERAADAVPYLTAALSIDEDGSLHYQLARAYQASGNTAKSAEMMKAYQEIKSRSEEQKAQLEKEAVITAP